MPSPAVTDLELSPGDKLIAGFFSMDGLSLALAETNYSIGEEVKTLVTIIRDKAGKPRDKIAAARQVRQIISDSARFSGLLASSSTERLTTNPDGTITRDSITQNRLLNHLSRPRPADAGDHRSYPPLLVDSSATPSIPIPDTDLDPFGQSDPPEAEPPTPPAPDPIPIPNSPLAGPSWGPGAPEPFTP